MMLAQIPQWLSDTAALIGAVTVIGGGLTAVFTRKPFRWLWARLVSEPFARWFRARSIEANEPLAAELAQQRQAFDEHVQYVRYHLGPNGDTTPVWRRLTAVEAVHQLETPEES